MSFTKPVFLHPGFPDFRRFCGFHDCRDFQQSTLLFVVL